MQLAVNTQMHPATFGGIANDDYIRKFIYAQGAFDLDFRPCPVWEWTNSITFPYFRNPKQVNGFLSIKINKIQYHRRQDDDTASNNERST